MNSMENFFKWMMTPVPKEDIIIWFNVHNMIYEKIELYGDIFKSLSNTIMDTYLGNDNNETKIILSYEDNKSHFNWCWEKIISEFKKENIIIVGDGQHKTYLEEFFMEIYYNQKEKNIKNSIPSFLGETFDIDKPFSKSDLELLTELYKLMEKNIEQ